MSLIGAFKDKETTGCKAEAAILMSLQDEEGAHYVSHTHTPVHRLVIYVVCMSCSPAIKGKRLEDDKVWNG